MDHATRVSNQLLNVNAHKITIIIQKFEETCRLVNKPGLAFVSTSRHTTFRMSHPILQGKPNASHMCAGIRITHT
jgi:hypothetical protein